jgi:GNAT superfamily N-acetyltransferase
MRSIVAKRLALCDVESLVAHLCVLSSADRRLRFGAALSDAALIHYVNDIDFTRDAVYGVYANDLTLAGVAHVVAVGETAELGLSVTDEYRRHGIGGALFQRAISWARNKGVTVLFMHCLTRNTVILHIAQKTGMRIVVASSEADAYLKLSPATAGTMTDEILGDQFAMFDHAWKSYLLMKQRIWRTI